MLRSSRYPTLWRRTVLACDAGCGGLVVGANAFLQGEQVPQSVGKVVGDEPVLNSSADWGGGDESAAAQARQVV